jgi:succinoglycan biosynthesis protein ExoO
LTSEERGPPPTVSVIIAAYNVSSLVGRVLDSVVAQTFPDWEIVVVDDASTDGTVERVSEHAARDSRIRLVRQPTNQGPSAARNRGLGEARGEWAAVLDADDAWRPERLERLLHIASVTGSDFVADNLVLYDDGVHEEAGVAFDLDLDMTRLDPERLFADDNPLRLGLMKPLIKRSLLERTGLRYEESLRSAEDFLLYAELLFAGAQAILVREPLYVYTTRVGRVSRKKAAGSRSTTSAQSLLWIGETIRTRYAGRLTPAIDAGLRRWRRMAMRRWIASEISRLRQTGNPARLLAFLARHPAGALRYATTSRTWARLMARGRSA